MADEWVLYRRLRAKRDVDYLGVSGGGTHNIVIPYPLNVIGEFYFISIAEARLDKIIITKDVPNTELEKYLPSIR